MENLAPVASSRIMRSVRALLTPPTVPGLTLTAPEANVTDLRAELSGPDGTPFQGGVFKLRLSLAADFPNSPPRAFFLTKIFHPNVGPAGEVCVNTLKKDWSPELGLRHVFMVIRCLLIDPNPESALNEEAGRILQEDYQQYAKLAQMWTEVHASAAASSLPARPAEPSTVTSTAHRQLVDHQLAADRALSSLENTEESKHKTHTSGRSAAAPALNGSKTAIPPAAKKKALRRL